MFKTVRRLILTLALTALVLSLAACKNGDTPSPSRESPLPAAPSQREEEVSGEPAFIVDRRAFTIGQYRYFALESLKNLQQSYGALSWETEVDGMSLLSFLHKDAQNHLTMCAAIERLAEENSISLSAEDQVWLDFLHSSAETQMGGAESYDSYLESYGLDRDVYYYASYISRLYVADYAGLFAAYDSAYEDELLAYAEEGGYVTVSHILLLTGDPDSGETLSNEELDQKRALAEELHVHLSNGADFDSLMREYSEDLSHESLTFGPDEMVAEFENTAFTLGEGEFSSPVLSAYGYHIIKRLPLSLEALWSEHYSFTLLENTIADIMDSLSPVVTEAMDSYDLQGFLRSFELVAD